MLTACPDSAHGALHFQCCVRMKMLGVMETCRNRVRPGVLHTWHAICRSAVCAKRKAESLEQMVVKRVDCDEHAASLKPATKRQNGLKRLASRVCGSNDPCLTPSSSSSAPNDRPTRALNCQPLCRSHSGQPIIHASIMARLLSPHRYPCCNRKTFLTLGNMPHKLRLCGAWHMPRSNVFESRNPCPCLADTQQHPC